MTEATRGRRSAPALLGTAVAVSASLAAVLTAAAPAGASGTFPVTLSSCGAGSAAGWTNDGDVILTVGSAAATTACPYGGWAQMTIDNVAGAPLPSQEPTFTTNNYAAGSPRFVIDLNNGHSLWGYPSQQTDGVDANGMSWAVDNGNTYTDWPTALTSAGVTPTSPTTVKDAYIVADADQSAGTSDTLTSVQYNDESPGKATTISTSATGWGEIKNTYSGKCLDVHNGGPAFAYAAGMPLQQYTCGASGGADERFQIVTVTKSDGTKTSQLEATDPQGDVFYVQQDGAGSALTLSAAKVNGFSKQGSYYIWDLGTSGSLAMDDAGYSTANGGRVIGYQLNKGTNQQWSLP